PGAFKGYIPGWGSRDYFELVRNEAELREWILEGISKRFRDNPLARHFLDRQTIRMPAYRGHLSPEELDDLVAYITWTAGARRD
ncbi:MAG: cytochrome c, partial [Deltaproteobacteria bacterium]